MMTRDEVIEKCGFDPANYVYRGVFNCYYRNPDEITISFFIVYDHRVYYCEPSKERMFDGYFLQEGSCDLIYLIDPLYRPMYRDSVTEVSVVEKKHILHIVDISHQRKYYLLEHVDTKKIIVVSDSAIREYFSQPNGGLYSGRDVFLTVELF